MLDFLIFEFVSWGQEKRKERMMSIVCTAGRVKERKLLEPHEPPASSLTPIRFPEVASNTATMVSKFVASKQVLNWTAVEEVMVSAKATSLLSLKFGMSKWFPLPTVDEVIVDPQLIVSKHWLDVVRYLNVPRHGSVNSEFSAATLQDLLKLQKLLMTESEDDAAQFVVKTGPPKHVVPSERP